MTSSDRRNPRQVPPPQGSQSRPASAYSRFIPREELAEFESWTPGSLNGNEPRANPASQARAAAQAQRQAAAEAAAPKAPTEAEWLERVQQARQGGYHDGYRDGLEALEAAKRQYAQQVSQQVAQLVGAIDAQIQSLEQRMAQAVVDTAVALARQVVRSEVSTRPELITEVAQQAIGAMVLSAQHLQLRLHPQDVALVEAGAGEALRSRHVQLQPDSSIEPGGCVLMSEVGQVDARIEQRWAQAAALFNSPVRWTAPADDSTSDDSTADDQEAP